MLEGLLESVQEAEAVAAAHLAAERDAAASMQRRDADGVLEGLLQSVQEAEAAALAYIAAASSPSLQTQEAEAVLQELLQASVSTEAAPAPALQLPHEPAASVGPENANEQEADAGSSADVDHLDREQAEAAEGWPESQYDNDAFEDEQAAPDYLQDDFEELPQGQPASPFTITLWGTGVCISTKVVLAPGQRRLQCSTGLRATASGQAQQTLAIA